MFFSPKTSADGLVFHYDTGNTTRSYIGEPTVNLVISPDGNANVITSDIPPQTNVIGYAQYSSGYFVNPRNTTNVAATGKTFTYSVWMRSRSATPSTYLMYVFTGTGPDGGWWYFGDGALTQDWKKYSFTRSDMTGTISQVTVYRYNQLGTIDIAAPQIEEKAHATPFTTGTRSVTQGLKDLTAVNTIDLSSVSFDSNAQIVFDGTDDFVDIGNLGTIGSSYSLECVFKSTSVTSYKNIFDMNYATYSGVTGNTGPRLEQTSGQGIGIIWSGNTSSNNLYNATPTLAISANTYYHLAFVQNGTFGAIYLNGTLRDQVSNDQGYLQTFGDFNIGRGFILDPSRYASGNVDSFKIYNRALTTDEVARNFNAVKSRFNIA